MADSCADSDCTTTTKRTLRDRSKMPKVDYVEKMKEWFGEDEDNEGSEDSDYDVSKDSDAERGESDIEGDESDTDESDESDESESDEPRKKKVKKAAPSASKKQNKPTAS